MRRLLAVLVLLTLAAGPRPLDTPIVVGAFSEASPGADAPSQWEPMRLGDARPSEYRLVQDGGTTVVRAEADRSASGLIRRLDVDPAAYPVLGWRWKVDNILPDAAYGEKDGDDYAARIYVTFDYPVSDLSFGDRIKYRALQALGFRDIPTRALNYVWSNQDGATAIRSNPFSDWVAMVPVESGSGNVGMWQDVERNIVADYRAAFGEEPPAISGIAIMTDGDNSDGQAVAYYGDIVLAAN